MPRTHSTIERLEARIAPAVVMAIGDFDGDTIQHDLRLTGGAGNERIVLEDSSTNTKLFIDANGDGDFTDAKDVNGTNLGFAVQQLEINLGSGNDQVTVTMVGDYTVPKEFLINLGAGNNEMHFTGTDRTLDAVPFRMDITGGARNDYLDLRLPSIGSNFDLTVNLGGGVDGQLVAGKIVAPSRILFETFLFGATATLDVNLGTGSNRFLMDLDEPALGLFGSGFAELRARITGSNSAVDKDDISVPTNDLSLDTIGVVDVDVIMGAGNDAFHSNFLFSGGLMSNTGNSALGPRLSFDIDGGPGNDLIEFVRVGTLSSSLDGLLDLQLRGGAGNDIIKADLGSAIGTARLTTNSASAIVRGLRLNVDAGAGNDNIDISVANAAGATFMYDIAIHGLAGNDTINFVALNFSGTPTYGPSGGAVVDGGLGTDSVSVMSSGGFSVRRFL